MSVACPGTWLHARREAVPAGNAEVLPCRREKGMALFLWYSSSCLVSIDERSASITRV